MSREVERIARDVILETGWRSERGARGCCTRRALRSEPPTGSRCEAREVFGRMGRGLRRYEWRACQVSVKAKFFEQG